MHRFFVSQESLTGEDVVLKGQQAHQIRSVLRMRSGDRIIVLDNRGWEYEAMLKTVGQDKIVGQIAEKRKVTGEPTVRITLYQSLLKQDKFEWVLQKCTEVGVSRFVPLITQRSLVRKLDSVSPEKMARWRSIITEAAEQSERGLIPQLSLPVDFQDLLVNLAEFSSRLIASPRTQGLPLRKAIDRCGGTPEAIALLIGSEGGFTEEEVRRSREGGVIPISLGKRILRAETAAVVASTLILYELDEMNIKSH